MMLMRWSAQVQVTAAAKMVMPRPRSCGSKSVTVVPSCTSPRLYVAPVAYRIRSVSVVLPASTCARMPRLRVRARLVVLVRMVASGCLSRLSGPWMDGTARLTGDGTQPVAEPVTGSQCRPRGRHRRAAKTPGSPRAAPGTRKQRCADAWPPPSVVSALTHDRRRAYEVLAGAGHAFPRSFRRGAVRRPSQRDAATSPGLSPLAGVRLGVALDGPTAHLKLGLLARFLGRPPLRFAGE